MNFYDREQQRIEEDEQDNQFLRDFFDKYTKLQKECENVKEQNGKYANQIKALKETIQRMQQEINSFKATKTNDSMDNTTESMRYQKGPNIFLHSAYLKPPTILNKTVERTYCVQQTKRKVINGFVDQLTQQLQQNQDLLKKQRKMQDQTRRALQSCNEELSILRSTVRSLENHVNLLSSENQQLLTQLQVMIRQKQLITEQLSANINENKKLKGVFLMSSQQFQNQMLKMDGIYKNIEMELKVLD